MVESVGLFERIKAASRALVATGPAAVGLVTPYESSQLARIAWAEHFQGATDAVNRNSAMQIPAMTKGRNVLAAMIASLPLVELNGETTVDQPWLYRTSGDASPWHRMAWTIDDLMFNGWSLWAVQRNPWTKQIIDAARVPFELWEADHWTGEIRVNGELVNPAEVILIPGTFEGIIEAGADTIRGARAVQRAWVGRAQNPIPLIELHQVTDDELEDDEIDELVETWAAARTSPTGAVGFTDNRVEVKTHGEISTSLFEEGRNAVVLDIARLTGLPAALLDGSMSTASLTYSTQEGHRNEFIDYALPIWIRPIEARLSMDDVCQPGRRIRFDLTDLTTTTTPAYAKPVED